MTDKKANLGEMAKKVFLTGLGAFFMTESAIRKGLSEIKMPKELAQGILENAKKQKDDLIKAIAKEFSLFLRQIDLAQELQHVLDGMSISIQADIKLDKIKKSGESRPKNSKKTKN